MQKQKTKHTSFINFNTSKIKSLDQFKYFFERDNSFRIESSILKSVVLNITDSITKNDVKLTFVIPVTLPDEVDKDLINFLIKKLIPYQDCIDAKNINPQVNDIYQTETNQTLSFSEQKDKLEEYIETLDIILDNYDWNSEVEKTNRKREMIIRWMKKYNFMTEVLEINNSEVKPTENYDFTVKELANKISKQIARELSNSELEDYINSFKEKNNRFNSISISVHGVKEIGVRDEAGKIQSVIDEANPSFFRIYLSHNGIDKPNFSYNIKSEHRLIDYSNYTKVLEVGVMLASKYNWSIHNFVKSQK